MNKFLKMLISNNKREGRKKASFALSVGLSVFLIAPMLLAGNDFIFIGSTTKHMAYAQEATNATTAALIPSTTTSSDTNNSSSSSSSIQLSPQSVLQERTTTTSQTPINQTHISA